jgi:hypothetical protein
VAKQSFLKLVSVGGLGFLVLAFGVLLLLIAAPTFLPSDIFGFAFSISRRAFTAALAMLLTVIALALLLIARALSRRHLH